jgi:hypothetical protein
MTGLLIKKGAVSNLIQSLFNTVIHGPLAIELNELTLPR